jgi:membrane-bound acyltransferase YfiQ involved in biofilm formation
VPWKLILSRVRSLAVPYLLWSVLILTVAALEGNVHSPARYLRIILTGRTASPYYFIPLLIQLYLLSPIVLVPLARKNWKLLLVVSAVIQLAVRTLIYLETLNSLPPAFQTLMPLTASWFFPGHLFWFAAGIVMGFNLEPFKEVLPRLKWRLLTIAAVLFPLGIVEWELILRAAPQPWIASRETLLDSVYAAVVILTFLAFSDFSIPAASQVSDWGSKSFGIYLAHSPILEYSARIIYAAAPWILAYQFLFQPILIILGLGVPLLMMRLTALQKSPVRPFYQHIFGQ